MTTLYEKIEQIAAATGCEIMPNALGRPMHTMTTTELITFVTMINAAEDEEIKSLFLVDTSED